MFPKYLENTIESRGVARNFLEGGSKSSKISATVGDQQKKIRIVERLKR